IRGHTRKTMIKLSWKTFRLLWRRCGRTLLITWPLILVITSLVFLTLESMEILSACRILTGGESQWAKAQKESVYYLLQYAQSHDTADYQKFLNALAVPLGDRKLRLEMEKPKPDYKILRKAAIEGGNHPDDLNPMVKVYRRFRSLHFMRQIIRLWEEGER